MAEDPIAVDAVHAMPALTRDELDDKTARGRFGRELPAPATNAGAFEALGYEVDADAVASAIVARLAAGRTLPCRPVEDG